MVVRKCVAEAHGLAGLVRDDAQRVLKLVRADVPDHALPGVVVAHDGESAVVMALFNERLKFVTERFDGVRVVGMDYLDIAVGLSIIVRCKLGVLKKREHTTSLI